MKPTRKKVREALMNIQKTLEARESDTIAALEAEYAAKDAELEAVHVLYMEYREKREALQRELMEIQIRLNVARKPKKKPK